MSENRAVVVVGAGFAGLAAAFAHARRGDHVTVLERAPTIGGRAAPDAAGADPFAVRVATADRALLALVRAAGVGDDLLPIRRVPSALLLDGRVVPLPPRPSDLPGVSRIEALRTARLDRLLARYRRHLDPGAPERAAPLDDRSLADFATLYFGPSIVSGWLEPWLAERAPLDPREASRAAFLLRWTAERDAVAGAFGAPLAVLLEALAPPSIRTGVAVERIEPAASQRFSIAAAGERFEADAVVIAVPAAEALRIADPVLVAAERAILAAVRYDAAIAWRAPARADAVAARVRIAPCGATPLASIAIERGDVVAIARDPWARAHLDVADDAIGKEIADWVERSVPGVVAGTGAVRRFPLAWPRFDVGAYRAIARLRAVEADRRAAGRALHWTGDWLSAPTLDGAVASAGTLP
jgi:predicted NAD/FAD-dependent oxidoreductase